MFEPVAAAFEGVDVGVVEDAVDHGGGNSLVAEDVAPAGEGQVAGQDQRGAFAVGDELEEQVRGVLFEGQVADLVDLCGYRHSSTYADTATMRRTVRLGVHRWPVAAGGALAISA